MAKRAKPNKKASPKEKTVAVRVVRSSRKRRSVAAKRLESTGRDAKRERLMWRLVIITGIVVALFWVLTLQANLTRQSTDESLWDVIRGQVEEIGDDFTDFWRSITGGQTLRPEDKYKELEQKVFPPLPVSAQEE